MDKGGSLLQERDLKGGKDLGSGHVLIERGEKQIMTVTQIITLLVLVLPVLAALILVCNIKYGTFVVGA